METTLIHVVFFRSSVGIQVHCVSDLLFRIQVQCVSDLLSMIQVSCASWTQDGAECFFPKNENSQSVTFICDYERAGFSAALSI